MESECEYGNMVNDTQSDPSFQRARDFRTETKRRAVIIEDYIFQTCDRFLTLSDTFGKLTVLWGRLLLLRRGFLGSRKCL